MSEFRRLQHGESEKGVLRFSPTDMAKCPIILRDKKLGLHEYKYTEKTKHIFAEGSKIHVLRGIYRTGSKEQVNTELRMKCIKDDREYMFTGYADFIMLDENGLYIEDLKSCSRRAFYFFNNEKGSTGERIQVSAYRWLYYVVFGVIIERAIITKIDRDNTLNKFSLEVEMMSINEFEEFLMNHPTVRILTGGINEAYFLVKTKEYIEKERWLCKYCDRAEECEINISLTAEEKAKDQK